MRIRESLVREWLCLCGAITDWTPVSPAVWSYQNRESSPSCGQLQPHPSKFQRGIPLFEVHCLNSVAVSLRGTNASLECFSFYACYTTCPLM